MKHQRMLITFLITFFASEAFQKQLDAYLKHEKRTNGTETKKKGKIPSEISQQLKVKHISNTFLSEEEEEMFYYIRNIDCSPQNCPAPNTCINAKSCKCGEGYANPPFSVNSGKYCQYEQKYQVCAFLLEFFIPGSGHFYAGRKMAGVIKLFTGILTLILIIYASKNKEDNRVLCLLCCCFCSFLLLYFMDVINYGINIYRDGNGVPLKRW